MLMIVNVLFSLNSSFRFLGFEINTRVNGLHTPSNFEQKCKFNKFSALLKTRQILVIEHFFVTQPSSRDL